MKRTSILAGIALAAGIAGCADEYMARRDSISPSLGEAHAQNQLTMIGDPWPRHAFDRDAPTAGARVARAAQAYRCGTSDVPDGGMQTRSRTVVSSGGAASSATTTPTTQPQINDC